jgi:hypothetical protein
MSQGKRRRSQQRQYLRLIKERPIATIKTEHLKIDAARFQYKLNARNDGESGSLSHVSAWNFSSEGILDVWLDPRDLQTYIVNGHNRHALATRLGVASLPCKYLLSKTWQDARRDGAISNISQGCGTALDAARFFRDKRMSRATIKKYGISLASNLVKHGHAIAQLCDRLFAIALSGGLTEDVAACIGDAGLTEDEQISIYRVVSDRDISDLGLIRELCQSIKITARETVTELTLFGSETFDDCLIFETATIQNYVRSKLAKDRRALVSATRSRDTLESAGSTIAVDTSIQHADRLDDVLTYFDREKLVAGDLSREIAIAAKSLRSGESLANACDRLIDRLIPQQ